MLFCTPDMNYTMGATILSLSSGHAPMVSHPKEVADLITLAAESIGKSAKPSRS
jgi:hypothetical protein